MLVTSLCIPSPRCTGGHIPPSTHHWVTWSYGGVTMITYQNIGSNTQILPSRVDFCFTTLCVPIVLVPYMEWDPIVTGTLTHAHDHKPDHVHNKVVSKQINMIKWWGWMASAEICTLWMIFRVSQVAWPETFKLCYDGISVWICPPPLSDLKLWWTAKIHSCWSYHHHLPKYWIHHSNIAFQSRFLLYNTTGPYSAGAVHKVGPNSDWYIDTCTRSQTRPCS